jgi:hypothetical protein
MIELLKSAAAINAAVCAKQVRQPVKDPAHAEISSLRQLEREGEAAMLSTAIQRLIPERDAHKSCAGTQELELAKLRAVNNELRRQHELTALLRDHYMRLATEMLTTLKHIDTTIHELVQKAVGANGNCFSDGPDAALISLARRLSPKGAANDHGEFRP